MKKSLILIVISCALAYGGKTKTVDALNIGIGPKVGIDGFGGSLRILVKDRFGVSLNAGATFDTEQEGGEIQASYRFFPGRKLNPYLLAGGGIQRIDIDDMSPPQRNVVVPAFSGGGGAELFLGELRRHGVSVEAAYRSGAVAYRGRSSTIIGQDAQSNAAEQIRELDHFSAKLLYHFYFIPWKTMPRAPKPVKEPEVVPEPVKTVEPVAPKPEPAPLVIEEPVVAEPEPVTPPEPEPVPVEEPVFPEPVKEEVRALASIPASMITFGANNSTLALSSIPVLTQLVDTLKAYPNMKLQIEGHTDISGNAEKNMKLSIARAERVKLYLVNSGVLADRLSTAGFGEEKPVADNSTFESRKKNRRVELIPVE